ncbi:hypothetical protein BRADI_4g17958v3 [Brachypodium distachyon]|uniref:Uncharacterized protein n=1 Tax=Brachypodium distachyon TaxID=15368 RepID=A0A0Q3IQA8_BRADI|nr:hypothetical protein BRADI_4g17958v3 [Brachypodium distachyon]
MVPSPWLWTMPPSHASMGFSSHRPNRPTTSTPPVHGWPPTPTRCTTTSRSIGWTPSPPFRLLRLRPWLPSASSPPTRVGSPLSKARHGGVGGGCCSGTGKEREQQKGTRLEKTDREWAPSRRRAWDRSIGETLASHPDPLLSPVCLPCPNLGRPKRPPRPSLGSTSKPLRHPLLAQRPICRKAQLFRLFSIQS